MFTKALGLRHATAILAMLTPLHAIAGTPSQAPQPGTVFTTTWLRVGPSDKFAVLDEVDPETKVQVVACSDAWCRVRWQGADGFVKQSSLSAPDLHAPPPPRQDLPDCFAAMLNGPLHGEHERFCSK